MAIVVRKFPIGKGRNLDEVVRFFSDNQLRSANIIDVSIQQLSADSINYIVTYEDTTAPFVVATNPTQGASNVGERSTVTITFSEPIQTILDSDVEVLNLTTSTVVSTSLYSLDNTRIGEDNGILQLIDSGGTAYLEAGNAYRIRLQTSIVDLAGNPLESAYNLFFGVATAPNQLAFEGGLETAFTNPSLNRWETTVSPSSLSYTAETNVQLTLRGETGEELDGFTVHYEPVAAPTGTFRIVLEHGNRLQTPEPTGILPASASVDWIAINGLR